MRRTCQRALAEMVVTPASPSLPGFQFTGNTQMSLTHLGKQGQTPSEAAPSKRRCLSQVKLLRDRGICTSPSARRAVERSGYYSRVISPHTVQSDTTRCGDSRVGHPGRAKHHLSILLLNNASEQYYITIG
jgi:hypothetical protein